MWIFMNDSFLSIVQDISNKKNLLVRSRRIEDIARIFPAVDIEHIPNSDYQYRVSIKRKLVVREICIRLMSINYSNFKNTVVEDIRYSLYTRVWYDMIGLGFDNNHLSDHLFMGEDREDKSDNLNNFDQLELLNYIEADGEL